MPSPYFNFSAAGAAQWWLDTFVGSAIHSPLIDGVYWDQCGPAAPPLRQVMNLTDALALRLNFAFAGRISLRLYPQSLNTIRGV